MNRPERNIVAEFARDDSGAVTVDWIVLTAAAVFLGIAATFFLAAGVPMLADNISAFMSDYSLH